MRWLDRDKSTVPACLRRFQAGRDDWSSLTDKDRDEIRDCLGAMQRRHCAYCERDLENESRHPHIEHFEQRSRVPQKTFAWSNLFWSCTQKEHCGKRKDQLVKSYRPSDLLKPDVDDPRNFLGFSSNGSVAPRPGLNPTDTNRAHETIRVFGLDLPSLRTTRKAYLSAPLNAAQEVAVAGFPDADAMSYLRSLAADYESSAFSAAIFDVLGV